MKKGKILELNIIYKTDNYFVVENPVENNGEDFFDRDIGYVDDYEVKDDKLCVSVENIKYLIKNNSKLLVLYYNKTFSNLAKIVYHNSNNPTKKLTDLIATFFPDLISYQMKECDKIYHVRIKNFFNLFVDNNYDVFLTDYFKELSTMIINIYEYFLFVQEDVKAMNMDMFYQILFALIKEVVDIKKRLTNDGAVENIINIPNLLKFVEKIVMTNGNYLKGSEIKKISNAYCNTHEYPYNLPLYYFNKFIYNIDDTHHIFHTKSFRRKTENMITMYKNGALKKSVFDNIKSL